MTVAAPLTEAHRQQQLAVRADTLRSLVRLWPALDWTRLDATYPAFLEALIPVVAAKRALSARLAADYLRRFRLANGITDPLLVHPVEAVDRRSLAVSVRVTTLVAAKTSAANGVTADVAMRKAFVQLGGAVSRHVLDAGRDTIRQTVAADHRARGWQRVTGGRACEFCRMLADRGGVYSEASAGFESHDHCGCSAEPVYH